MSRVSRHIEDYGLIGDCESAALVGRDGSIDWLCWPRFDSDACFAALLGGPEHGRWLLAPSDTTAQSTRSYREDTLILETRFQTESGSVLVVDFMPPRSGSASDLMRLVIGERGVVPMHLELVVRFGYGVATPWVTRINKGVWTAVAGPDMVVLHTDVPVHGENMKSVAHFTVEAGQKFSFALTYARSHHDPVAIQVPDVPDALADTELFWKEWIGKARLTGRWQTEVKRSLITLRALIHQGTGGIIAAPTTSLPECIGGTRNWDYRFCWLRDATLTLLALMNAGFLEEAKAWRNWLLRAIAGSPRDMQIMYGVAGERRLDEWELPWLPGYEQSQPVRVGNAAYAQLQIDVFGEVMDAIHQARANGLAPLEATWNMQLALLAHLAEIWDKPDYGIWEVRGPPQHFTYSKIMAWVAFDRAVQDAERYRLQGPVEEWRALCRRIHAQVCEHGYNERLNSFVQAYGSEQLDASLLLIPELGFLPPEDPRITGTIRAIESRLMRDGLVQRYDTAATDDGLPPGEGAFLACSFWLVDAYAMCGRRDEAEALFERLVKLSNDLGLLAEQFDTATGRQIGNFPQGFSHLSLINSAFNLGHRDKPVEQRSRAVGPSACL
ncbi:glycoside hydrolase family 15 protein [Steroidobacter sp. S1-65]|uniref:Glycoside hydrolase family 15 protein n=1 Tax=Steroidobacter gossypii TaxID=2805490 RepID=A0ABS1X3K0_9GAMM|nr:glycoside hydrolase family 15 protein [Steroidobacter gossypii]MBM0107785.1 glycoside hydrolase family 15 protein [Steroidobacter gossypii]